MGEANAAELAELTSDIVAAYVANNSVRPADLPALISSIHDALGTLGKAHPAPAAPVELKPAVAIKKSITDDYLVSLEDGRKFKSLKRHLAAEYGMSPDEYRAKWGLPKDYPMVAPSYAKQRSSLAKSLGLGRKPATPEPEPEPAPQARPEPAAKAAPKKPSRSKKAA